MISAACYLLTYIFEAWISRMYFSQKFNNQHINKAMLVGFGTSIAIQFGISYIGIPFINLLGFVVCNFLLCLLLFKSGVLQALFNTMILAVTMLITELCVFHLSTLLLGIEANIHTENDIVLWIQAVCAKLLYFFVTYLIAKLSTAEHRKELKTSNASLLMILPLASIVILIGIAQIMITTYVADNIYIIFIASIILLLCSNTIVFWIHESMIKVQNENLEYRLQKQKSEIDTEYYGILQTQYEHSNALVHDTKKHLLSIKELALSKDFDRIEKYIDDLYDQYQIKYLKKYSEHKLVNAIANRYVAICRELGIDFYCDVRNVDFSFISDSNLISILDNLLENAVEAAKGSEDKLIELTVNYVNENFVVINIVNSCSSKPLKVNGKLKSTKEHKGIHGYGLKIIKRIAKENGGSVNYNFDENKMQFTISVVLNTISLYH